ncbi:hypothetical protein C0991_006417 [Blastosporella zonata]|nr:hypothetical protein C0991_006417 [Blastosporella zonata]
MKIAIQGCCHGDLDAIYGHIDKLEKANGYKVDLLLICGDFQAMRNWLDLTVMSAPDKYKEIKDFHKYYSGARKAPIPTIVIGGNHEASNYLWELYHGGWLAPNIYFLGHAGSLIVNGLRISGSSGIYKDHDFNRGHYEKLPYDRSTLRSIYHTREYCVRKLSLLPQPDIFMSHDWPQSIAHYGDLQKLVRHKGYLKTDISNGRLGSPPLMGLLKTLKPKWWFAAHMHTRFEATVPHGDIAGNTIETTVPSVANPDEIMIDDDEAIDQPTNKDSNPASKANPDEINLSDEELEVATSLQPPPVAPSVTNFLALDKCLPNRKFLEVVDIPTPEFDQSKSASPSTKPTLSFDPLWLAITRAFHPNLSLSYVQATFPSETHARALVERELLWVNENVPSKLDGGWGVLECQKFIQTAPPITPTESGKMREGTPQRKPLAPLLVVTRLTLFTAPYYTNPQTEALCKLLEIPNKINPPPRDAPVRWQPA